MDNPAGTVIVAIALICLVTYYAWIGYDYVTSKK